MLTRSSPNLYQEYASEPNHAPDLEPWWPPDNPNTIKSRQRRAEAKRNKFDPVDYYGLKLRSSAYHRLLTLYEKANPLGARALSLDDKDWRKAAAILLQDILENWHITPPTRR